MDAVCEWLGVQDPELLIAQFMAITAHRAEQADREAASPNGAPPLQDD